VCIVKAVGSRTTSAKLAAKMKADSTTPEKQKVVNAKFVFKKCIYVCMCVCVCAAVPLMFW